MGGHFGNWLKELGVFWSEWVFKFFDVERIGLVMRGIYMVGFGVGVYVMGYRFLEIDRWIVSVDCGSEDQDLTCFLKYAVWLFLRKIESVIWILVWNDMEKVKQCCETY